MKIRQRMLLKWLVNITSGVKLGTHYGKRRIFRYRKLSFFLSVFQHLPVESHYNSGLYAKQLFTEQQIFRLVQFKSTYRTQNKCYLKKFVLGQVENIMEKGENAGYQHFLLFS